MSGIWYNENDPYAAEWLRNLMAAGAIPSRQGSLKGFGNAIQGDLAIAFIESAILALEDHEVSA